MSDDESITTEEMNEIITEDTFEEVEVKGVERKNHKIKVPIVKTAKTENKKEIEETDNEIIEPEIVVKPEVKEKKPMSDARKASIEKLVENNKKRAEQRRLDKELGKPVKETKPTKHTKEIIKTEKIIYMIPDNSGGYKEVKILQN